MLADYWDVVPRVEHEKLEATCRVSGILAELEITEPFRAKSNQIAIILSLHKALYLTN